MYINKIISVCMLFALFVCCVWEKRRVGQQKVSYVMPMLTLYTFSYMLVVEAIILPGDIQQNSEVWATVPRYSINV